MKDNEMTFGEMIDGIGKNLGVEMVDEARDAAGIAAHAKPDFEGPFRTTPDLVALWS